MKKFSMPGFQFHFTKKALSLSIALSLLYVLGVFPLKAFALKPHEVLVIANSGYRHSVELAEYYIRKRDIPAGNLMKLRVTDREYCERDEFEKRIASPVRDFIEKNDRQRKIRCLLIMYGMPLKILPPKPGGNSQAKAGQKKEEASLDSEIALVLERGYDLSGWQPNPFYVGYHDRYLKKRDDVFIVSRLDGPSREIVRRVIDDSLAAEKIGLKGKAYFDARWPGPANSGIVKKSGYDFYDHSVYMAADVVEKSGLMPVIVNREPGLFQKGDCPEAALYCGWYSLGEYVDAFEWLPGAVGYHIASAECKTLKEPDSLVWCKKMLEKGVAATLGPVSEPYVRAFPVPELFYRFLLDGFWTLSECYALSQPFWSWQMVLIGDPLYRPFRNKAQEWGGLN